MREPSRRPAILGCGFQIRLTRNQSIIRLVQLVNQAFDLDLEFQIGLCQLSDTQIGGSRLSRCLDNGKL
jgi:hypothetical protein